MKLADYMDKHDLKQAQLAQRLGISQQTVCRYLQGGRIPRPAIMRRISELTNGEVGPADLYEAQQVAA